MRIINITKNIELASNAELASSFLKRTHGLMARRAMRAGGALILKPCNSVHTCFMRFSIDVVFLKADGTVIGIETSLKPWRLSRIYWKALYCIEFSSENLPVLPVSLGDKIALQE